MPTSRSNNPSTDSRSHHSALRWYADNRINAIHCPSVLRPWLLDRDSLTRHLVAASEDQFQVEVVNQQHRRALMSESKLLGSKHHQRCFIREVVLKGQGAPWVFGRTVIPLRTLTGRQRALRNLESRPLGALLFAEPSMTRGPVQVTRLTPGNTLVPQELFQNKNEIWGRRSLFFIDRKPLLVNEIFLPDFTDFLTTTGKGLSQ